MKKKPSATKKVTTKGKKPKPRKSQRKSEMKLENCPVCGVSLWLRSEYHLTKGKCIFHVFHNENRDEYTNDKKFLSAFLKKHPEMQEKINSLEEKENEFLKDIKDINKENLPILVAYEWWKLKPKLQKFKNAKKGVFKGSLKQYNNFLNIKHVDPARGTGCIGGWGRLFRCDTSLQKCEELFKSRGITIYDWINKFQQNCKHRILYIENDEEFLLAQNDIGKPIRISFSKPDKMGDVTAKEETWRGENSIMPVLKFNTSNLKNIALVLERIRRVNVPSTIVMDDDIFLVSIPKGYSFTKITRGTYAKEGAKLHKKVSESHLGRPPSTKDYQVIFDEHIIEALKETGGKDSLACKIIAEIIRAATGYASVASIRRWCWDIKTKEQKDLLREEASSVKKGGKVR